MKIENRQNILPEEFKQTLNPAYIFMILPSSYSWVKQMDNLIKIRKVKSQKEDAMIKKWIQKLSQSDVHQKIHPFQYMEMIEIMNIIHERKLQLQKVKEDQKINEQRIESLFLDGINQIEGAIRKIEFFALTTLSTKKVSARRKNKTPYSFHTVSQQIQSSNKPQIKVKREIKNPQIHERKGLKSFFKQFDFNVKESNHLETSQTFYKPKLVKTFHSSEKKQKKHQSFQKQKKELYHLLNSNKTQNFTLQSHAKPYSQPIKKDINDLVKSIGKKKQKRKLNIPTNYRFVPKKNQLIKENQAQEKKGKIKHIFLKKKTKGSSQKNKNSLKNSKGKQLKRLMNSSKGKGKPLRESNKKANKEELISDLSNDDEQIDISGKTSENSYKTSHYEEKKENPLTKEQLKEVFDDIGGSCMKSDFEDLWNRKRRNKIFDRHPRNSSLIIGKDLSSLSNLKRRRGSSVLVEQILEKNIQSYQKYQPHNRNSNAQNKPQPQQKVSKTTIFKKRENLLKRRSLESVGLEKDKEEEERIQFYNFYDQKGYKQKIAINDNKKKFANFVRTENYHEINPGKLRKQFQEGIKLNQMEKCSLFEVDDGQKFAQQCTSLWKKSVRPSEKKIQSKTTWKERIRKFYDPLQIDFMNRFLKESNCLYQTDGCGNRMNLF